MGWSYSGDPASSVLDAARFLVGDVDTTDQLLSDEEIKYAIKVEDSLYSACAVCCESLARQFSRQVDTQMGNRTLHVQAQQRAEAYTKRAVELRKLAIPSVGPYSATSDPNTSRKAIFTHDMMNDYWGIN